MDKKLKDSQKVTNKRLKGNNDIELSSEHINAVNRPRRIVANHPEDGADYAIMAGIPITDLMEYEFGFADENGSQIDGQWWSLNNIFPMKSRPLVEELTYPLRPASRIQSMYVSAPEPKNQVDDGAPIIKQWAEDGINLAKIYVDETHKRGLECFFSYRMAYTPWGEDKQFAETHPDRDFMMVNEFGNKVLDFSNPEVRKHKLSIISELAHEYNFDGIEIDFSRNSQLTPAGNQWENRAIITEFMEEIRSVTLSSEKVHGSPTLLAARIPDNILGCRFDGLDIESWVSDNLIDILVLGVRSLDLDIEHFRHIVGSRNIKILATLDDHHTSDGYSWPGIEVMRGLAANWWQQGIDGIQTFNWGVASPELAKRLDFWVAQAYIDGSPTIPVYQQAYKELGSPDTLHLKDKTFVVQRRGSGGSGGAPVENWTTPRYTYQNTNMLGELPGSLDNSGKTDTLLKLRVGDDLIEHSEFLRSITLKVLLSDSSTLKLDQNQTIEKAMVTDFWGVPKLFNSPPRKGIEEITQVRINNSLLPQSNVENGWLLFTPNPNQFAVGLNLIGICLVNSNHQSKLTIEKVELHIKYK